MTQFEVHEEQSESFVKKMLPFEDIFQNFCLHLPVKPQCKHPPPPPPGVAAAFPNSALRMLSIDA